MMQKGGWFYSGFLAFLFILNSCSGPLEWPESPLYVLEQGETSTTQPPDLESSREEIAGHYAHYDVVAYEDTTTRTTMRTFIVSYGFTDFYLEEGRLMQSDRFVHAEQKLSRKNAESGIQYGSSRVTLNEEGKIIEQRDYYDLWGDIFDNIPRFGKAYRRFMKRKFG